MSKIDITRTELVWPGKYDEKGQLVPPRRVSLPFQVIERVNETRATREQRISERKGHYSTLFDYWQAEKEQDADPGDDWRNKLIWGDNLYVMGSLLESFAGKIDLIYIDPPFATGTDFSFITQIGDANCEVTKEQSIIEEKAYRDTWGNGIDSYLKMLDERISIMKDLLSDIGSLFIHLDMRVVHFVKIMLDDLFGRRNMANEIIWCYTRPSKVSNFYPRVHDTILFYSKTEKRIFNSDDIRIPYHEETLARSKRPPGEQSDMGEKGEDRLHEGGKVPEDWWQISILQGNALERTGFSTQKPESLLERLIKASSNPNSLLADFFCGSGTTLAVAENLGRRWIGCDLGRYAIHTTRKRLLDIEGCKPFEILNLGRYERQVWQGVTFAGEKQTQQMLVFEYLKFILELYGAQPLAGTQHLHGKKGNAMIHVGAVDAPVTIQEINACLEECRQMKQKELHVLGWEWEMGLANIMVDEARGQGVKLLLLNIPREVMEQQAVEKGDIHFYELAYLEVEIHHKETKGKKSVTVELTDFVIPNDDLIPPEVRAKIKKWSDYVDYWAVDWDFREDTFVNGWTSYRTRRDRALKLKTEPHEYPESGNYRLLVKAIDIFGNDTSQAFDVEVN